MLCRICHGLVEEAAHVHLPCLWHVLRPCALRFVEDPIPRVRPNGTTGPTHAVICPNPALQEVQQDEDLQRLLE